MILQPLADHQGSKILFREYSWTGPYIVEKVLSNENYIVSKLISNKTQILHHIRLRKHEPNTVLQDIRPEGILQPDDEIVIPQDDLNVITRETNFGDFPNSNVEIAIPTRLDAADNSNSLGMTLVLKANISQTWTFGPPGHMKMKPMARLKKHALKARMTGLTNNNRQEGAILSCPKYQTMERML